MLHLKRKQKSANIIDEKRMRELIQEELSVHDETLKAKNEKEKEALEKLARLKNMPKAKRAQLIRYLKRRGEQNGKNK